MFSNKTQLNRRTPENGTDRENFLSLLVDEYIHSASFESKCQVLANLANFAYDPINYGYIRDVGVLDIFLYVIKNEKNEKLLNFASSGVSNLCIDPMNAEYIINNNGLKPIIELLKINENNILTNAITILYYMNNDFIKSEVADPELKEIITNCKKSDERWLSNIASIFLDELSKRNYQKICKIHTTTINRGAFKPGDKIRIQKTLTQKDLDNFSNLTNDYNDLHRHSNKRPIVHGALLNGLVAGLIGTHLPGPGTVVLSQTMKFPNKCFVGEKLTISVELVDVRKILKVKFNCVVEEEKKVVFEGEAKLMLTKDV